MKRRGGALGRIAQTFTLHVFADLFDDLGKKLFHGLFA